MSKYLAPLGVFLGGNAFLLILWLFFPALGVVSTELFASTAEHADVFWGWSWVVSSTRILVFVIAELFILFGTLVALLRTKS
jgi:hypothetical protein